MSWSIKQSAGYAGLALLLLPVAWAATEGEGEEGNEGESPTFVAVPELLPEASPVLAPIDVPLQDAVYRSGLNPEALAAAGVTSSQLEALCQAVHDDLVTVQPILDAADSGAAQGRTDVGRLSRLVRSGRGQAEDVSSLAQAKADCEAAMAEQKACLDHFHASATEGLTEAQRTALVNIRANKEWKAPAYFKVVTRTPEEWMTLEEYLDIERIEARWGHELDAGVAQFLADARADADVAAAKAAYETNLASLKTALDLAIRD